jgi:hypothetical protein
MRHCHRLAASLLLVALVGFSPPSRGVTAADNAPEVLTTDLAHEIDKVARIPERFAVEIPHRFDVRDHGQWNTENGTAHWRYALRVPGAVSLSFHADLVDLPSSAVLEVSAGSQRYRYSAKDVHRGELWSRIGRGDTLSFSLSVNSAEASRVVFAVSGVQAGYRSLGGHGPNHPHYDALQGVSAQASASTSSCSENYECHVTNANAGPGQASVTLVIQNLGLCSGVLVNDALGDGVPYVLTARHCENGNSDGGDPGAAAGVTAYFDATTPCGQTQGTIYSANTATVSGATTVVEQQDAWLIRLDGSVPAPDAFYSGWDATGGSFVGGYSAHYALGNTRQYTGWYGQAYYQLVPGSQLGVGYNSTFWELVNQVGSIGPGASGSGVYDPNNRLVGTVVRGVAQSSQPDSPGVCPVVPPPAPSPQTATAMATAFSGIFDSTADPLSTTGAATLRSVLDPKGSGTLVLDGRWQPVVFSATSTAASTGSLVTLTWNVPEATSCTAGGGVSGDGWSGSLALAGSLALTEYNPGAVTYSISCATTNGIAATGQVTVTWSAAAPAATIQITPTANDFFGGQIQLTWTSTVAPCTATGGASGDGWSGTLPGRGSQTVSESAAGTYTYGVSCGTSPSTASAQVQFTFVAPSATLGDGGVTLVNVGQPVTLTGAGNGLACTTSGGAAGDGWAGIDFLALGGEYTVTAQTPGTYTYTLTCAGNGTATATSSVTVTYSNGPPQVTLTTSPVAPTVGTSFLHVSWVASVAPCSIAVTGYQNQSLYNYGYIAYHDDLESVIGPYTYTVTCGAGTATASASATVNWVGTPKLNLAAYSSPIVTGQQTSLSWVGNVAPCTASGGAPGDGWSGSPPSANGYLPVTENQTGTYTYTLTCGSGTQVASAQATLTVDSSPVSTTLTASAPTGALGGPPVNLSWSSNTSPCQQTGGSGYDGWLQSNASSGTASITEMDPGTYTFQITCGSGITDTASAQATIVFTGPARPTFTASTTSANAAQPFTLTWKSSDGSSCAALLGSPGDGWSGALPSSGSKQIIENVPGPYAYQIKCGVAGISQLGVEVEPPQQVPALPPPANVQLTANTASAFIGQDVTLTWSATSTNSCTASGGSGTDGWGGAVATSGSATITGQSAGSYQYTIACSGMGSASAMTTVRFDPLPTLALVSSVSSVTSGVSFTLSWNSSEMNSCTAGGGSAGDGWTGSEALSGSATVAESSSGTYTYALTCTAGIGAGSETIEKQVAITVTASTTSGGNGGGHGGGGALDDYTIAALGLLTLTCLHRRHRGARMSSRRGAEPASRPTLDLLFSRSTDRNRRDALVRRGLPESRGLCPPRIRIDWRSSRAPALDPVHRAVAAPPGD